MTETAAPGPASGFGSAAGGAGSGMSPGTMLRQAREASGLHVATVAIALKVPVRKLEALEADRFDELPDAVFVRALAASVCRTLKIDPAPVLQLLPATMGPRLASTEGGINAPFRSPRDGAGPTWLDQLSRPVFLAVFALLLGALVLILLPSRHEEVASAPEPAPVPADGTTPPGADPVLASATPDASAVPVAAPVPVPPAAPLALAAVTAAPQPLPAAARAAAAAVATPPTAPVTASAATATAAAASADGIVVFKAKASSWVQVTDARGAVPLRKLLAAGESAAASGALPLAVTVGSVSATDVQVRGKPFNLAPVSRDNVAHFEVK